MRRHISKLAVIGFLVVCFLYMEANAASFNVRDFGAAGDNKVNDGAAIQAAIDTCHETGGGTVYFPPGVYLSREIRLKSFVTLHLENGATLLASPDTNDFTKTATTGDYNAHLIVADNAEHIAIIGQGIIRGQGEKDLARRAGKSRTRGRPKFRVGTIMFRHCKDITIKDITILYSETWTATFEFCERLFIDGVTIFNNYYRCNSDGIDPVSCKDVQISNCHITAGDDCICLKTENRVPCENVVVTNCTLTSVATAIKFGTASHGDFRNIHISNCSIRNSTVGIGLFVKDGGTVERVTFSDISITNLDDPMLVNTELRPRIYPIFADIEKRFDHSRIGAIRDITFRDIYIESDNGILIQGMRESPIENMTLENITVRVNKGFDYSDRMKHHGGPINPKDERIKVYARKPSYATVAYTNGLVAENIRVLVKDDVFKQYPRSALSLHEINDGFIRSIYRDPAGGRGAEPVVNMENCQRMFLTNCFALPGTEVFLGLSGAKTDAISLVGNNLKKAVKAVVKAHDVSSKVLE